jgi:putative two-component system response regulator
LPEGDLEALYRGGILHDLGKVAVPDAILLKPGPLTPEERGIMQEHPVRGYEICQPLRSFRNVLPIIRHHHEQWNGTGYPDRLRGNDIPLLARILQVVDIFDALTTDRPYRRALSSEKALATMEEETKAGKWDPQMFPVFAAMVRDGALPKQHLAAQ